MGMKLLTALVQQWPDVPEYSDDMKREDMIMHFDRHLPRSVCIDGHSAAACLQERELRTSRLRVPPPFPEFWLEWSKPDGDMMGCVSISGRIEKEGLRTIKDLGCGELIPAEEEDCPIYKTTLLPVVYNPQLNPVLTRGLFKLVYYTNLSGDQLRKEDTQGHYLLVSESTYLQGCDRSDIMNFIKDFAWYYFSILWFLTVRNITLIEGEPSSRKHCRHMAKALKRPQFTYKTVGVSSTINKQGDKQGSCFTRDLALHTVMGHFATYSKEKPLFGKYSGTFYIPGHVRGKKDCGIRHKQYDTAALSVDVS